MRDHVVQLPGDLQPFVAGLPAAFLRAGPDHLGSALPGHPCDLAGDQHQAHDGRDGDQRLPRRGRLAPEDQQRPVAAVQQPRNQPPGRPMPPDHRRHQRGDRAEHERAPRVEELHVGQADRCHRHQRRHRVPPAGQQRGRTGQQQQHPDGVQRPAVQLVVLRPEAADHLDDRGDHGQHEHRRPPAAPRRPAMSPRRPAMWPGRPVVPARRPLVPPLRRVPLRRPVPLRPGLLHGATVGHRPGPRHRPRAGVRRTTAGVRHRSAVRRAAHRRIRRRSDAGHGAAAARSCHRTRRQS